MDHIELTETEKLRLENLKLKMGFVENQMAVLLKERDQIIAKIESRLNVDLTKYQIDLNTGIGKLMGEQQ